MTEINQKLFYFFYNLSHHSRALDTLTIFIAETFPYIVLILAGLFLLFHHEVLRAQNPFREFLKKKKEVLFVFFTSVLAYFISVLLKMIFHTTRPYASFDQVFALFDETGYAFPSSHAIVFSTLAFSIFFLHKRAGYVFMAFALLIGIARIVAGVHFPLDILGGFALGALVAYLAKSV